MAYGDIGPFRLTSLGVLVLLAGCASVEPVPAKWEVLPSVERVEDVYPAFAIEIGMGGRVELSCAADAFGTVTDCTVVEAEPAGLGFEQAAVAVARTGRVRPATVNGVAQSDSVQFAMPFALGTRPQPPAPWTEAEPSNAAMALARQVISNWAGPARRDPASLDVAPDRADRVADLIFSIDREMHDEGQAASAVYLARMYTEDQLRMLTVGQRRPSRLPWTARTASAGDRIFAFEQARSLRLRQANCAHYECGAYESVF